MPTPPVISRKRKRAHQYTVSYSKVQEVDEEGRVCEVIVIEDTPPPSTISPATTHTNVFSASYQPPAQTLSASTLSAAIMTPAPKKREQEPADDSRTILTKKTAAALHQQQPVASTKSWASGSGLPWLMYTGNGNIPCDDKEGHYIIVPDDIIYNRYRTVRLLGQGTFGKVVEAVDIHNQDQVAIKIIHAIPKYCDASKIEIHVLQKLKEHDPSNVQCISTMNHPLVLNLYFSKCIHLLHWFDHRNHICLKENEFAPFPRNHIQLFARQLLGSVALRSSSSLGWSYPCDAYSLGCILVEFYTGHLAMIEMVMGKKPDRFTRLGAWVKPKFFKDDTRLDWPKPKASWQSKKDDQLWTGWTSPNNSS
ncbi:kinase-like domain-containing protein [Suillus subluteus]|nr:kinase-like domain-containing protein [Suillus subluteus]